MVYDLASQTAARHNMLSQSVFILAANTESTADFGVCSKAGDGSEEAICATAQCSSQKNEKFKKKAAA